MTHKQQINAAAAAIAAADGWKTPEGFDFVSARVNYEKARVTGRVLRHLALAEAAFEAITGDSPDYADEEEDGTPCVECGKPRTKAEGGTTFTRCDECWEAQKENVASQTRPAEPLKP